MELLYSQMDNQQQYSARCPIILFQGFIVARDYKTAETPNVSGYIITQGF